MTQSVILFFLLLVVLASSIIDQTYALLSLTLPVRQRNNGILFRGNLQGQGNSFQRPETLEGVETTIVPKTNSFQENFDSEEYRQKMVDIVYQSSMERFS